MLTCFAVSWLWIDSLCIIQDSKDDWLREATQMDKIYQHAQVNFSADFGEDSRAGLLAERDPLDVMSIEMEAPRLGQTWKLVPDSWDAFKWMETAPSLQRAWIHRERQLARRILHFTEKEMVWECCATEGASFASEKFPWGAPFKPLFHNDNKYQSGRRNEALKIGAEETYATWNDICETFSRKYVTYPTDMPVILSSLASDFTRVLPGEEYLAGLWRSTLPQSLTWETERYAAGDTEYIAPSWSWMSVDAPVKMANRFKIAAQHPLATVLEHKIKLKYDDSFGPLENGKLHIEGIVRSIRIDFTDDGRFLLKVNETAQIKEPYCRNIGPVWEKYEGNLCNLSLDSTVDDAAFDCYCLLISMNERARDEYSNYRTISCLLLNNVDWAQQIFKRIGVLELADLYALKMRYVDLAGKGELPDEARNVWHNLQHSIKMNRWRKEKRKNAKQDAEKEDYYSINGASDEGHDDDAFESQEAAMDDTDGDNLGIVETLYRYDEVIKNRHLSFLRRLEPQELTIV